MWSYLAAFGCYLVCTYAAVIIAVAGHRTRIDANGTPDFINHPAGWYAAATDVFTVLLPAGPAVAILRYRLSAVQADLAIVVQRALEPAHLSLWTDKRR